MHAAVDEFYGLGLMPVACGDLVLEHDTEEMRRRASEIPAALISSKGDAPLISECSSRLYAPGDLLTGILSA